MKINIVHGLTYRKGNLHTTCGIKHNTNNSLRPGVGIPQSTEKKKVIYQQKELLYPITCKACQIFSDPVRRIARAKAMNTALLEKYGKLGRPKGVPRNGSYSLTPKEPAPRIEPVVFPGVKIEAPKDLLKGSVISDLIAGRTIVCELRVRVE